MSKESETITLEGVTGITLAEFSSMKPEDKGYEAAIRAVDMLMRHVDEANRRDFEIDKANEEARHAKEMLEFEKEKHQAEVEQLKRQNDLKEFEIQVAKFTAYATAAIGVATIGRDVWEFLRAGILEETGTFKSLVGKIATSRINKR